MLRLNVRALKSINNAVKQGKHQVASYSDKVALYYEQTPNLSTKKQPKLSTKECFEEVKKFLTVGKLQQAAEKCWFGTSTALENLADRSRKGLVLPTHHSKNVFRYFVSSQLPAGGSLSKETFNDKYRVAESLHRNYYQNESTPRDIDEDAKSVSQLVQVIDNIPKLQMTGFEEFLDDWGLQIINNRVVPAQKKTKVITEEIGHSVVVSVGKTLCIIGQLGMDCKTGAIVEGGIKNETEKSLENMGEILTKAGATYKNVVQATIHLADMADLPAVNDVYNKYFEEPYPTYKVDALPTNARIEIDAIAVLGIVHA